MSGSHRTPEPTVFRVIDDETGEAIEIENLNDLSVPQAERLIACCSLKPDFEGALLSAAVEGMSLRFVAHQAVNRFVYGLIGSVASQRQNVQLAGTLWGVADRHDALTLLRRHCDRLEEAGRSALVREWLDHHNDAWVAVLDRARQELEQETGSTDPGEAAAVHE